VKLLPVDPLPTPFPECYWVLPGLFLAGEYPGARRAGSPSPRLAALLEAGITRFIDLTQPGELPDYRDALRDESYRFHPAVHYRSAIGDFGLPNVPQVKSLLDWIDAALEGGEKIYLHCQAGIGRTGTLVGCYLARHGSSGRAALTRLNELRHRLPFPFPSPETEAQRQFVLKWKPNE
jgi:protein-tyrosine phosphatase